MKRSELPPSVQRAARTASVQLGRATASARMKPNFLICGAQRCGTTSMYRALIQHPSVVGPNLHKGVHYFDVNYGRGISWYQAHFQLRASAARLARRTGHETVTFESSPYYLFHPLAAERIARDLPGIRVIVLLRDPVERAYSGHAHELARGYETEPFERALELEDERLAGEAEKILACPLYNSFSLQHHSYLHRGRYLEQLSRLEKLIGRDRIHVVDSDHFFSDPQPAWHQVSDFLGLSGDTMPKFEKHNARPRAPMPESLRQRLNDGFSTDDEGLAEWLGHAPSWRA